MVMDENGRNGWNWHLAQQIIQPVIRYILSSTTIHIARNIIQTPIIHIVCNHAIIYNNNYHTDMGGIFISLISIKKIPPYAIIIIYNLLTNKWLKYGIIRWY